jgi:protocatechuate 4,5-dioxygenase alpha subunit
LLEAVGDDRAILVGMSLGANIAMAYSLAYPAKVAGLFLASPGLPGHRWPDERPPEVAAALARSHGLDAAKAYWLGHDMFASLADHPAAARRVAAMVEGYSGSHWLHPGALAPLPTVEPELEKLEMPVLVVNGARDLAEYRLIGRLIAEKAPNARRVELGNAGHVVNLEEPDEFRSVLGQFIDFIDHAPPHARLAPPIMFDLASPGTFVYSGMDSSRGERLNAFALSLRDPGCRRKFLSDETGYMGGFDLSPAEVAQVLARDWTGLLQSGGHLQAILKLAATVGQSLWDVGAHNAGIETATLVSICPRRVSSAMPLAGGVA